MVASAINLRSGIEEFKLLLSNNKTRMHSRPMQETTAASAMRGTRSSQPTEQFTISAHDVRLRRLPPVQRTEGEALVIGADLNYRIS